MPAGVEVTRELDEQVLREVRVGVFVSDGEHGLTAGAAAAERLELRDRGQHPELESARLQPSRSGSLGARSYSATCSTDGATYADSVVIVPAAGSNRMDHRIRPGRPSNSNLLWSSVWRVVALSTPNSATRQVKDST